MKLKYFIAILMITFINICPADDQAICINEQLFFTIQNPTNTVVSIQMFDTLSQIIYEYSIEPELHPDSEVKNVLINFYSDSMIMKAFSLNKFGRVISPETEISKRFDGQELSFSKVLIVSTDNTNDITKSSVIECYSEISDEHSDLLNTFLRIYNSLLLENSKLAAKIDLDKNEAYEFAGQRIDQLMQFSGYRKDSFGVYIHVNDTTASY